MTNVRITDLPAATTLSGTELIPIVQATVTKKATASQLGLGGAIPLSTVTTNGDLIVGTANAAVTRLPAGTVGQLLAVDSTTTTGLKWVPAPSGTISTQDEGIALSAIVTTLNFVGAGVTASGAGAVTTVTIPTTADATTTSKGVVQLAGDLAGTAAAPTLIATGPGLTGPLGSATVVPVVSIDTKGRVTALTSATISIPESAVVNLATDLAAKAADASVVHNTGAETVAGAKTFSSEVTALDFKPSGLTGAIASSRYVGGTVSGAPTTGTFVLGDWIIDQTGKRFTCTTAGTPGTWTQEPGTGTGGTPPDATTTAKGIIQLAGDLAGTAAAPTVPGLTLKAVDSTVVHNTGAETVAGAKTFTSEVIGLDFKPSGLTGAIAASRYAGATTSGAPTTGTFTVGDFVIAQNGIIWICTIAGTPGTWVSGSGGAGGTTLTTQDEGTNLSTTVSTLNFVGPAITASGVGATTTITVPGGIPSGLTGAIAATRYVGGTTSGAPTTGTFVVGDFVVAQNGIIWICTVAGTPGTWVSGSGGTSGTTITTQDEGTTLSTAATTLNFVGPGVTASGVGAITTITIPGSLTGLTTTSPADNVALGTSALTAVTTGVDNTAIGYGTLLGVTTGSNLTGVGSKALTANTTGTLNTAVGYNGLAANTTGLSNTALGYGTLASNVAGGYNTALGESALAASTASYNTAIGCSTLLANTTGANNLASGYHALTANTTGGNNTAVGYNTLAANTTVSSLTALGYRALQANTTGTANSAAGYNALTANTTGTDNTAFGYNALAASAIKSGGTAFGTNALALMTGSNQCTAIGSNAFAALTTGYGTALGYHALFRHTTGFANTALGANTLQANLTGSSNTAVGESAAYGITGDNNTALGAGAIGGTGAASNNTSAGTSSLNNITTGTNNAVLGMNAMYYASTSSDSVAVGYQALGFPAGVNTARTTTGLRQTAVGTETGQLTLTARNDVVMLGYRAQVDGDNAIAIGSGVQANAAGAVAIGKDSAGTSALTITVDQIKLGTALHSTLALGPITGLTLTASGLTGAVASARYVGATASGAPATGTFILGDWIVDQTGKRFTCTVAGTPGTWIQEPGTGAATPADATATSKGIVQLAGDLAGTAALPTVPGLTSKASDAAVVHNTGTETVGGAKTFTSEVIGLDFKPSGLTGAVAASRYVGATASAAPTTGTFLLGDWIVTQDGKVWICTTAGTPGTWSNAGAGAGTTITTQDETTTLSTAVTTLNFVGAGVTASGTGATTTVTILGPDTTITANPQTASYGLVLSDAGKAVDVTTPSASTVTVSPNSTTAFPLGTVMEISQLGAGQVTITPGTGVTLRSSGGKLKTASQYSAASIRKIATDEWLVSGDLTV